MGLYLAEVFNVIYQGLGEVKPQEQIGTITVNQGDTCQLLYSVDRVDTTRPSIQPGDEIILTGPAVAISSHGPLSIDFDLFCGNYKDSIYFESYPTNGLMQNAAREKRILSEDGTGEIVILYALFDNAMEANLEVKLVTDDNSDVRNLHGVVAASVSDFDRAAFVSMLFLKKPQGIGIDVAHGGLIPLSRSTIAVLFKSRLSLEFHLFSGDEEFVHDTVEFHADPSFKSVGRLSCKKGDIIIEITWRCSRKYVEPDIDCEIIAATPLTKKTITLPCNQSYEHLCHSTIAATPGSTPLWEFSAEDMLIGQCPVIRFGSGQKPVLSPCVARLLTRSLDTKRRRRDIYVNDINSSELSLRLEGTKQLAQLLEADPRIGDLRPQDIRVLIGFLGHQHHKNPELQFYALFALTNVDASGGELLKTVALPLLMRLMKSKHSHIQIRVLITLCRIAHDFPESTWYLIQHGLKVLQKIVVSNKYHDMILRNCSAFFAIVCRGIRFCMHLGTSSKMTTIVHIASCLLRYGRGYDDVQSQTIAALSFLSSQGQLNFGRKASSIYLGLISDADPFIVINVLKLIMDILTFSHSYQIKWMLIGCGLLQRLHSLSHCKYKAVRFLVCWILHLIVLRCGKEHIWPMPDNGGFKIVENKKMPLAFTVIKDLGTGQEIDFADNFFDKTLEGKYVLSPSSTLVSIGPFSPTGHLSFSRLRWVAEVRTLKHFVRWKY